MEITIQTTQNVAISPHVVKKIVYTFLRDRLDIGLSDRDEPYISTKAS